MTDVTEGFTPVLPSAGGAATAPRRPEVGILRGVVLLGLTFAALVAILATVLVLAIGGFLPEALDFLRPQAGAPYVYEHSGRPEADHDTLAASVRFVAFLVTINGLVVLAIFALLHRWLARGGVARLCGSARDFRRDAALGAAIFLPLYGGLATWQMAASAADPAIWIAAAPLAALVGAAMLPIQTLAEEIIFRGFVQRWLTHIFRGVVWPAALLQSGLFAVLHGGDMLGGFLLGLIATLLVLGRGNLGLAWAFHTIHNATILSFSFLPARAGVVLPDFALDNPLPLGLAPSVTFGAIGLLAISLPRLRRAPRTAR